MNPDTLLAHYGGWLFFAAFFLLMGGEAAFPLRRRTRPRMRRWVVNLGVSVLAFVVGVLIVRHAALATAAWADGRSLGLLPAVGLPTPIGFALGFLLMDLTFYYWHRANHVFPLLWRFHRIHHVDPDLDVTTSFRFHLGEVVYSTPFRVVQVLLIGATPTIYIVYEFFFQLATMFHHSNLHIPIGLERLLNRVIVTPRMHGIHHSQWREETNTNYSVIFRVWDALHRSLRLNIPQAEISVGVDGYGAPHDNRLMGLLVLPFRAGTAKGDGPRPPRLTNVGSEVLLE